MTCKVRHAYLIMAHNNPTQLVKLLSLLDDPRNDIFLHIDLKAVSMNDYDFSEGLNFSSLKRVESIATNWGGASLVQVELNLLKMAVQGSYSYYHLISGADLPIKTQNQIHCFFNTHAGKEFVHFSSVNLTSRDIARVKYRYPIQELIGRYRNIPLLRRFLSGLSNLYVLIQKGLGVNRLIPGLRLAKGGQWFSISHDLATYVIERTSWIQAFIDESLIPDELFLQTLVLNSSFSERLYWNKFDDDYRACMRAVEWRPRIYTYKSDDFQRLVDSECLFARKFDVNADSIIIDLIVEHLKHSD